MTGDRYNPDGTFTRTSRVRFATFEGRRANQEIGSGSSVVPSEVNGSPEPRQVETIVYKPYKPIDRPVSGMSQINRNINATFDPCADVTEEERGAEGLVHIRIQQQNGSSDSDMVRGTGGRADPGNPGLAESAGTQTQKRCWNCPGYGHTTQDCRRRNGRWLGRRDYEKARGFREGLEDIQVEEQNVRQDRDAELRGELAAERADQGVLNAKQRDEKAALEAKQREEQAGLDAKQLSRRGDREARWRREDQVRKALQTLSLRQYR